MTLKIERQVRSWGRCMLPMTAVLLDRHWLGVLPTSRPCQLQKDDSDASDEGDRAKDPKY